MFISRFVARKAGEGKRMECSKYLYQNQRQWLSSLLSFLITPLILLGDGWVEGNVVFWLLGTTVFHEASSYWIPKWDDMGDKNYMWVTIKFKPQNLHLEALGKRDTFEANKKITQGWTQKVSLSGRVRENQECSGFEGVFHIWWAANSPLPSPSFFYQLPFCLLFGVMSVSKCCCVR